jgi:hypothetical protein
MRELMRRLERLEEERLPNAADLWGDALKAALCGEVSDELPSVGDLASAMPEGAELRRAMARLSDDELDVAISTLRGRIASCAT